MTRPRRYAEDHTAASGRTRECCWPIGNPGETGFRFCGTSTSAGRVYCAEHAAKAFAKPQRRTALVKSGPRK
jgi:hypothetical protein